MGLDQVILGQKPGNTDFWLDPRRNTGRRDIPVEILLEGDNLPATC